MSKLNLNKFCTLSKYNEFCYSYFLEGVNKMDVDFMSVNLNFSEMSELENIVTAFFKDKDISFNGPVDIYKISKKLGFIVYSADLPDEIDGLLIVDESKKKIKGFESNKLIAYNSLKRPVESKFIVAHELAHYIIRKVNNPNEELIFALREHSYDYSNDVEEQKVDYIAAALLIPKEDFKQTFQKSNDTIIPDKLYMAIAKYYGVDIRLASRRYIEVFGNE